MSFYLVDFENVKSDGLKGIDKLSSEDTVIIFYSENADKISLDMYNKFKMSKADIKLKKVAVGTKNALDFQLAAYLGYSAAKNGEDNHFIVSNDNGYSVLCNFWKNISICAVHNIEEGISAAVNEKDSPAANNASVSLTEYTIIVRQQLINSVEQNVTPYISGIIADKNEISYISGYVKENFEKLQQGDEKVKFNNLLGRRYGSTVGGKIYRAVQSFYKETTIEKTAAANSSNNKIHEIINKKSELEWIAGCINETHIKIAKDKQKSSIHNSIREKYGSDIGGKIYKAIKSVI